jgi:hypothetical protein
MHAPSDLRSEYFETFAPNGAGGIVLRSRQRWRHGEVELSVQSDGLTYDSELTIELLELTANPVEGVAGRTMIGGLAIGGKELIQRGLDNRRFCGTGTLGRCFQSLADLLREMNAKLGIHG